MTTSAGVKKKAKSKGVSVPGTSDDPKQVLKDRARALSKLPQDITATAASMELLEFRLAQECYAIETNDVIEVYPFKNLTSLPGTPSFVLGVVNVRGRIIPVIDIKKFFDLPDKGITDLHRIILVSGNGLELGLLADAIVGVQTIPMESLQGSLPTLTGIRGDYLKGVTAERLVVLDLMRILTDPRIIVHEEVEN